MNDETINEAEPFLAYGHEVVILGPTLVRLTIKVPWPRHDLPTVDQRLAVMKEVNRVIQYVRNNFFEPQTLLNILVMTSHSNNV